jgi:hypothetical protein
MVERELEMNDQALLRVYRDCQGLIPHSKAIEKFFLSRVRGLDAEFLYAMGSEEPSNIYRVERQTKKRGPIRLAVFFSEPSNESTDSRMARSIEAAAELVRGRSRRVLPVETVLLVVVNQPREGDRLTRSFDAIVVVGNKDGELYTQLCSLFPESHQVAVDNSSKMSQDPVRISLEPRCAALLLQILSGDSFKALLNEPRQARLMTAEAIRSYLAHQEPLPRPDFCTSPARPPESSVESKSDLFTVDKIVFDQLQETKSAGMTTNPHIAILNEYQPFGAGFKQIYFESSSLDLKVSTQAFCSLSNILEAGNARVIILTGDAGHGKTHLCGQILSEINGITIQEASKLLRQSEPNQDVAVLKDGRGLRIIKDLSEFASDKGKSLVHEATCSSNRVTIICANEGRLRTCADEATAALLDANLTEGRSRSHDGSLAMINLNFQSVVSKTAEPNIFRQVVQQWIGDDAKWSCCDSCEVRDSCPIHFNRTHLSDDTGGESRLESLETLLRVSEQTGHIITVRTLLIYLAHILTGRLSCEDVHRLSENPDGWQSPYLYHQLAFGDLVPSDMLERIQVFSSIRKLDPGLQALRQVDDRLDGFSQAGDFSSPAEESALNPTNPAIRHNTKSVAQEVSSKWRTLRRKDFFEADFSSSSAVKRQDRLGLLHLHEFEAIIQGDVTSGAVRDSIMRGLEAVQGVYRHGTTALILVNPAFSSQPSQTFIVDATIGINKVRYMPLIEAWSKRSNGQADVNDHVDWLERVLVVSLGSEDAPVATSIQLFLHEFEFLMRTSQGLRSREFFAAEIRRMAGQLAMLERAEADTSQVSVFDGVSLGTLLVEGSRISRIAT